MRHINGERHHHDEPVKVGEMQVWDVDNMTKMDHPFHLHGFFFQVLAVNGEKPAWRSMEDVINVPPKGTVSQTQSIAIVVGEVLNAGWMVWLLAVAGRMPDLEPPRPAVETTTR